MPSAPGTYAVVAGTRFPASVQCTAHLKSGEQCRKWSTRGTTVCKVHGAGSPKVKRAAERAVQEALAEIRFASPLAVRKLIDLMDSEDETVVLRASDLILKRALPDNVRLEIEASLTLKTGETPADIIRRRMAAMSGRIAEIDADSAEADLPEPEPPYAAELAPRELTVSEAMLGRYRRGEHPSAPTVVEADSDPAGPAD